MSTKLLDGTTLRRMLIGAAETIRQNSDTINDLNVFPVPDGDTGTNMCKTIEGGIAEISSLHEPTVSDVSYKFAHGSLLGARGNSGVILSQIFAGIEEELVKCNVATAADFVSAYRNGIKKAYSSVMNPAEGTILTVFREATEYAAERVNADSDIEDFLSLHIEEAKRSLARTKDILPALKEADVVDSGGAGYVCIASGMYAALTGKNFDEYQFSVDEPSAVADISAFTRDSKLEFGYCTEFLLRLQTVKTDPDTFSVQTVTDFLESIGGESIVAYKTDDIIKAHVHTANPGAVLTEMRRWGEFLTIKIENMALQHNETALSPKKKKHTDLATIAVASGEGICALFEELGADIIIDGGQTNNPSAEEFLKAFEDANADNIVVLPNNKNVFLAVKQAAELWEKDRVHIIPTESLMQGYAALSVISPAVSDIKAIVRSATDAANNVIGAEITRAIRDAVIGGVEVKCGEYIAISAHAIKATAETAYEAVISLLEGIDNIDDYEIITLFAGKDVTADERAELTEKIEELYSDHELVVYDGAQEIYSYFVAVE